MPNTIRICEWVKQYPDLKSKDVIDILTKIGYTSEKKLTATSNMPQDAIEKVAKYLNGSFTPTPKKQTKQTISQNQGEKKISTSKTPENIPQKTKIEKQGNKTAASQSQEIKKQENLQQSSKDAEKTVMSKQQQVRTQNHVQINVPQKPKQIRTYDDDDDDEQSYARGGNPQRHTKFNSGNSRRIELRDGERPNQKWDKEHDKTSHGKKEQQPKQEQPVNIVQSGRDIHIKTPIVVKNLAEALGCKPNEVIVKLLAMNVFATINQTIEQNIAQEIVSKFGCNLIIDKRDKELHQALTAEETSPDPEDIIYKNSDADLKERPPIITFMGHVDHGKTSLQDAIRKTHVTASESGGITQHIGASVVSVNGKTITFVDTPGHEAFSKMRARGANVTDIVVLVVAADDGFMPQTIEAMNHAKAAKVPIIVAVNKMDLPEADYDKILLNMQQHMLTPEDWGGDIAAIKVSARTGMGISDLLERILLEAEMLELKSNPQNPGQAYVLESQLEQGFGPTASIVVRNGTVRVGDTVICGQYYGKIRTLLDSRGKRIPYVGPGMPAKVVGLSGVPLAGTKLAVCDSMTTAKQLAEERKEAERLESLDQKTGTKLEDLMAIMANEGRNDLKVIVKTDVRGSTEAIIASLQKMNSDKIKIDVIHSDVGAITDSDVNLAASASAIIIGFHVRVNPGVNEKAKSAKVEIRLYSIIYELLEDISDALIGRLEPEKREKDLAVVKIRKIFHLSNGQDICGCIVEKGVATVGAKARVLRNSEIIFNGEVRSLRHLKDDVKEVRAGMECGIRLDNFADFTEGDIIQLYEIELKRATL